ncbi:MAG TPA: hypothetical protein VNN22_16415 [Verrucomicrobiae bacterium]|nr:hypothetical protein [Verrucomicrobiae bacterium]
MAGFPMRRLHPEVRALFAEALWRKESFDAGAVVSIIPAGLCPTTTASAAPEIFYIEYVLNCVQKCCLKKAVFIHPVAP